LIRAKEEYCVDEDVRGRFSRLPTLVDTTTANLLHGLHSAAFILTIPWTPNTAVAGNEMD
jgi:hypothetical protein